MTITVVGMWEKGWLDPSVEHMMLRQLRGAYKFDRLIMIPKLLEGVSKRSCEQYDTIEEALENVEGTKVFLEPNGEHRLSDIPGEDIVYIMGNASRSNERYVTENDLSVRI